MAVSVIKPETSKPKVLILSGYDAASHKRWREHLAALLPEFHWQALTLPPRFFRWRIRGNPLSWLNEPLLQEHWDLIIATSMVDLATLRGLHPRLARTPCLLYMHENQFAFPVSSGQNASADPQMVNLYSALSADCVVFNSGWNRDSFLDGVDSFCRKMPDRVPEGLVETLRDKSRVIPVPIEDRLFADRLTLLGRTCPHLLWNHRWEYDKGPDRLLNFLQVLEQRSLPFRLSVVGERFRSYPKAFDRIREQFDPCSCCARRIWLSPRHCTISRGWQCSKPWRPVAYLWRRTVWPTGSTCRNCVAMTAMNRMRSERRKLPPTALKR
jgi:glycosyltransferase involved in cell wall biosynthesis